jgi:hypothetical protein
VNKVIAANQPVPFGQVSELPANLTLCILHLTYRAIPATFGPNYCAMV